MNRISPIETARSGEQRPLAAVDVWCLRLDVGETEYQRLFALLNEVERARAEAYRQPRDRRRYAVRRGLLRELLASRIGCAAEEVVFSSGEFGKLFLADTPIKFNVSHSYGTALFAITETFEIGCDVECLNSGLARREAAALVLSCDEREALGLLPEHRWSEAFLKIWTCKEAWLKARGIGLDPPLSSISVSTDDSPRFVALPDDDTCAWSLACFHPTQGFAAAVAMRGAMPVPRLRSGPPAQPETKRRGTFVPRRASLASTGLVRRASG